MNYIFNVASVKFTADNSTITADSDQYTADATSLTADGSYIVTELFALSTIEIELSAQSLVTTEIQRKSQFIESFVKESLLI